METPYLFWYLLIPLTLSLVIFVFRWLKQYRQTAVELIHLISTISVLVFSIHAVSDVLSVGALISPGGWLHVDALGAVFLLIIGVVGFLAGIYSIGYTRHDLKTGEFDLLRLSTYYGLFNLFLFTMLLVVTANNIIIMWVAIEATTLGSAFLVGIYQHRSSLEAAWKYVIICTVGVAFGLYGTVLVYSDAVNVIPEPEKAVLWTEILKNTQALDPVLIKMAFVFILIGFGTKAGIFPMHTWLPDAHSEAPSPVSAMLSAVLLNCALLVILRFGIITDQVLGAGFTQILFVIFGFLSIGAAALFIYVQHDIKRLFAYSSMENIGLIVLAFGLGGPVGILAGLLHTINHSLVKALLFCSSGNILMKYRSRNMNVIKGMTQTIPATGLLLMIGAFALIGTPPFNIFISKFLIITTGLGRGYKWLMIILLLLLSIIFAAFVRVIASSVFGEKPEEIEKGEFSWLTLLPPSMLAILVLILGLYIPPQLVLLLERASSVMLNGTVFPASVPTFSNGLNSLFGTGGLLTYIARMMP